jgi:hypothetical protein
MTQMMPPIEDVALRAETPTEEFHVHTLGQGTAVVTVGRERARSRGYMRRFGAAVWR